MNNQDIIISDRKFESNGRIYSLGLDYSNQHAKEPSVIVFQHYRETPKRVPSGWYFSQVWRSSKLWIDGRQNWFVNPPYEAWDSLAKLLKNKSA